MATAQKKKPLVFKTVNDIPTFEELCTIKGWKPEEQLPNVTHLEEGMQKFLIAATKREHIRQYINDDWEADFNDGDQRKYYIWSRVNEDEDSPSVFRLSYIGCGPRFPPILQVGKTRAARI